MNLSVVSKDNVLVVPSVREQFRDAMANLGAAVNIVTTAGPGGRAGFTASAVCSVTDAPPTVLVCLNRSASAYPSVMANGVLCVNVLGGTHEALSGLFGGKTPQEDRFAAASWIELQTGAPALSDALVSLDCRIAETLSVSTHDVLICSVVAIRKSEGGDGLAYFDRRYQALKSAARSL